MRRYVEKMFFQWNVISLVIILLASEAFVLAIDGHFYNDTMLIYMLPLILWGIRGSIQDRNLTWKRLGAAMFIGVAGCIAAYNTLLYIGIKNGGVNHLKWKILYIGCGIAAAYIYLAPYICENINIWRKKESKEKVCDIVLCALLVPGMWIQKEVPICSVTGWIAAFICFAAVMGQEKKEKRINWLISIFSVIFSCCMAFGNMIHISAFLSSIGIRIILGMALSIAGWYMIWKQCILRLLTFLNIKWEKEQKKNRYAAYMLLMLAAWLPYFLGFYPGVLSSDSIDQVLQAVGRTVPSNHHPWIHTQLIGICYKFGYALAGGPNAGVAVYSLVSMILLAVAFAGICQWQYRIGIPRVLRWLSIIFLALCPFNGIYSITMWKDIPFTAFVILFMLNILEILEGNERKRKTVSYTILSIFVCIFRSNGIYVWIFTVPFLLWALGKERVRKWAGCSSLVLSVVVLYKIVLLPSLDVLEPDIIESLSIPVQQIACVAAKGGEIPHDAMEELEEIVDMGQIAEVYDSHTSDPVKGLVRSFGNLEYLEKNKGNFARLYIDIGLRNPYYYLEAFIEQTKGYWYHKENDWIYHTYFITENDIGIYRDGKFPEGAIKGMEEILTLCLNGFHVVCSLALFTYTVLFGILVSLINRRHIAEYMPLIGLVLTLLLATPRYADFRYVYPLFAALPLCLGNMVYTCKKQKLLS